MALATSSVDDLAAVADPAQAWRRWLRDFLASVVTCVTLTVAFILVSDPFDTGRLALLRADGAAETRAAFAAASRGRDPRFNAAIIGNSRAQLLDPARLSRLTGQRFVQLSVPAAHVAEQAAIAGWFLDHHQAEPVVLLIVLDDAWCSPGPLTGRPFPFWLFGNSFSYALNVITPDGLDKSWRRVRLAMRWLERPRPDGYDDYELIKAWDQTKAAQRVASPRPVQDGNVGKPLPAVGVLGDLIGRAHPRSRFALMWAPVHVNALPVVNSPADLRFRECKREVAAVANASPNVRLIDWRVPGQLASKDTNFWDLTHYRGFIARQLEDAVVGALLNELEGEPVKSALAP